MLNFTKALNTEKRKPGPGNRGDRIPGHTIETVTCQVRSLLKESRLDACRQVILDLMMQYPDAAQPHNLMGLLLEKEGSHIMALHHFRAAVALEPGHRPSLENLNRFSELYYSGEGVFAEEECRPAERENVSACGYQVGYDRKGMAHLYRLSSGRRQKP
ncbi:hypothetical protein [Faecalibaculum rodentium]|uniref:hypothetical protein n=2 Tax=Faecalibaculum rodentium TaxID=1702221 RepID=UPI00255B24F4|nr:hypothetical protein [Faecalibaculum rodentium]